MTQKTLRILGTHGVPAEYGGFETAAENVALHLADKGWRVIVYCQKEGASPIYEDRWSGIERVFVSTEKPGWRGTSDFDLKSTLHACKYRDPCLIFGYNTAVFNVIQRVHGIPIIINTDGIEWSRKRWGLPRQSILYVNERIALLVGNRLIADHPVIEDYLQGKARTSKISMIAYGGHHINSADESILKQFGLVSGSYMTLICRPIPENSILDLVQAFSYKFRNCKLAILGSYDMKDEYQRSVIGAASKEVVFLGPQYDKSVVESIRYFSFAYLHGHTVGGTNPSLVEAMGAGNPIIAKDNAYNRWVAGEGAIYFDDWRSAEGCIDRLLKSSSLQSVLRTRATERFCAEFTWERIGSQYEQLLNEFYAQDPDSGVSREAKENW